MSNDYFSYKPRSFFSKTADLDEKHDPTDAPNVLYDPPQHARRPTRLIGYQTPSLPTPPLQPSSTGPRVPRLRTLLRLLLIASLATLTFFGWRCEPLGCKGRGGGALVGDYVGGGSVVAGWGEEVGMDLSAVWDRPTWGGERQGRVEDEGSSTFGSQSGDEEDEEEEEEDLEGVLGSEEWVEVKDGAVVEWDSEEGNLAAAGGWDHELIDGEMDTEFVPQSVDGGQAEEQKQEQVQEQNDKNNTPEEQKEGKPEEYYGAYESPVEDEVIPGLVGELTGPVEGAVDAVVAAVAADSIAHPAMDQGSQQPATQDESKTAAEEQTQDSWLGSVDSGLW